MSMAKNIILILQAVVSIAAVALILLQVKGTGFGRVWGGGASFTRRGLEKIVFKATFVLVAFFIILSVLQFIY